MAERSPHHPKTEGSSPAASADTARDKIVNKIDQLGAGSQRIMINANIKINSILELADWGCTVAERSPPHHPKIEGSSPATAADTRN